MASFGPVLILKYDEEKSLGTRVTQGMMEVFSEEKSPKETVKALGNNWWNVSSLFNYVVNLFSGRAKPKDVPKEYKTVKSELVPTEIEEKFKVNKKQSKKELKLVADKIVAKHKQLISRTHPPSSNPGEYPAMRSGTLHRSISTRWGTQNEIKVGYSGIKGPTGKPINYSQKLADSGRLSLIDTANAMKGMTTASNRELRWEFTYEYV